MGYKTVAKALSINDKMVRRWVSHFEREGLEGLKEKEAHQVQGDPRNRQRWKKNYCSSERRMRC
ncbi:helix-turn-helix domain-containing protein [Paenibacillus sp. CC-CFT747]|nr:helix-turn-helix domain-containing protein [Paenibacillus sp. CC-CFT747]